MNVLENGLVLLCTVLWSNYVQGISQMHMLSSHKEVILNCPTSSPWFFCVWEGPHGDRACALRKMLDKQGNSMCGEQDRLEVRGNSSMCTLVIKNPQLSDHGEWTCAVSDDSSLDTVKEFVQLEIVDEGEMVLTPETSSMEVVEGEKVELVCMVDDVFPPPEISWSVSRDMVGLLDTSSNKVISPSSMSHMVSIQHNVFYTPSHMDHGINISCISMQGNMSNQVKSIKVMVEKKGVPEMLVEESVGMIPLLIISVLVVVVLVTSFLF